MPQLKGGGGAGSIKAVRVTTGSVPLNSSASITVTWPSAFADTNYTVALTIQEDTVAPESLVIDRIITLTNAAITVRVRNTDLATASTGTIHAIATT